jgi:hypothetical protein
MGSVQGHALGSRNALASVEEQNSSLGFSSSAWRDIRELEREAEAFGEWMDAGGRR